MRLIALLALLCWAPWSAAQEAERLHLLIPAGPGGGLDSTARAMGLAVQSEGMRAPVSFENMTGGGGGRALGHFVETAERQAQSLMINSTPLLVRSLQGLFPHSYRDIVPIAGLVAEYSAIVVRVDSKLTSWKRLVERLQRDPTSIVVGGGSVRGNLDHIVFALAAERSGVDPRSIRYLPYDAGGKAMLALLGGEVNVLSTGLGETLSYAMSNDVRVLAISAPERVEVLPEAPTLTELGTRLEFANWRGVFAPPGLPAEAVGRYEADLRKALAGEAWQAALALYGWAPLDLYGSEFTEYLEAQETLLRTTLTDLGFIR